MSKAKNTPKRVIKTVKTTGASGQKKATASRASRSSAAKQSMPLIFGKQNYILMGVGAILIALGLILMAGGGSEDPNVFNADEIYSFRRITLAPFIIILGLVVEVFAIFKK